MHAIGLTNELLTVICAWL